MTKDEALKLALEALECALSDDRPYIVQCKEAITAIKEALAQPGQKRFLVATIGNWGRVEWADGVFPSLGDKMYSAPRTWDGLTNDELTDLFYNENLGQESAVSQAIALLKEKNT